MQPSRAVLRGSNEAVQLWAVAHCGNGLGVKLELLLHPAAFKFSAAVVCSQAVKCYKHCHHRSTESILCLHVNLLGALLLKASSSEEWDCTLAERVSGRRPSPLLSHDMQDPLSPLTFCNWSGWVMQCQRLAACKVYSYSARKPFDILSFQTCWLLDPSDTVLWTPATNVKQTMSRFTMRGCVDCGMQFARTLVVLPMSS